MDTEKLVEGLRAGDDDAFRALYRAYSHDVYDSAMDAGLTDDQSRGIVKNVFIEAYRSILSTKEPVNTDYLLENLTAEAVAAAHNTKTPDAEKKPPRVVSPGTSPSRSADTVKRRVTPGAAVQAACEAKPRQAAGSAAAEPVENGEHKRNAKRSGAGPVFAVIFSVILLLAVLWVLIGVLMGLKILPVIDLGYTAFDNKVFPLFMLTK